MTVDVNMQVYDDEQIRLMGEMCIVVDENDTPLRPETKKNCHLKTQTPPGLLLHRAFSVFLFSPDGRLLLQQRADEKITFPGFFTNTCCSHPLWVASEMDGVDGARRAAQRKLEHELGIPAEQVPLEKFQFMTRLHYLAASDGIWGEHEMDYIFIIKAAVTVDPSPNEVKSVKYVTKDELKHLFATAKSEGISLTPWFQMIVERFLYKWWDRLDDGGLKAAADPDTIHRV
ncbi:NUDIX hydrolase domain-like protein [Zopfochytrium polystomum]|nr:NUDIX hydrolase domain-like protein [Zopfochytrium polystomum]KAI9362509.1 NUDIX hydrolase domain-like protein [Zopfochytrium polystomum]